MPYRGKRSLDLVLATITLVALSPIILCTFVVVRIVHGKPAIFRQTRPGKNEISFELLKFRSMTNERTQDGVLLDDKGRLTALGRFIRSTSIDELPSLVNVLKGEMSIVGPRPLMKEYLSRYTPWQRRRHLVKPGITGLAQVSGRNNLRWRERFEYDVLYVDSASIKLDVVILLKTLWIVLLRKGISANGEATMYEFTGDQEP